MLVVPTLVAWFYLVKNKDSSILIRVKAAAWRFNQLDNCVLPCKAVYWPKRSPGKFPGPFIRPSKQIRRLLASLLYKGQVNFPTLLPFSGAGKFLYQLTLCLLQNFSPITYLSRGILWLLCECELVYYFNSFTLTVNKIWEKITDFILNNTEKKLIIWYYSRTFSKWPPKMWRLSGRLWNLNHRGSFAS